MLFSGKITSETICEEYKNEVLNFNFFHIPSNLFKWVQYLADVFKGDGYFKGKQGITITKERKDEESA